MLDTISLILGLVFMFVFLIIITMIIVLATFLLGHVLPLFVVEVYEYFKTRKTKQLVRNRKTKL